MSDATRQVVVCDRNGNPLRTAGVLEVHEGAGVLHKAFSVLVFRNAGAELLLQQRSRHKPLFALRWANTCCSHPAARGAPLGSAAERRLQEELGFSVALREVGAFVYQARDPASGLSEHEHDTVLIGEASDAIAVKPDPGEVADWRWMSVVGLERDLREHADAYAPWLSEALRLARGNWRGSSR